jgi:hypothetical protein
MVPQVDWNWRNNGVCLGLMTMAIHFLQAKALFRSERVGV